MDRWGCTVVRNLPWDSSVHGEIARGCRMGLLCTVRLPEVVEWGRMCRDHTLELSYTTVPYSNLPNKSPHGKICHLSALRRPRLRRGVRCVDSHETAGGLIEGQPCAHRKGYERANSDAALTRMQAVCSRCGCSTTRRRGLLKTPSCCCP